MNDEPLSSWDINEWLRCSRLNPFGPCSAQEAILPVLIEDPEEAREILIKRINDKGSADGILATLINDPEEARIMLIETVMRHFNAVEARNAKH
ncbi:hypothetical protein CCP4SC76_3980001 [Gammaproteobacteria bacterium]